MFRGRVRAAAAGELVAVGIEAVVVAGNDLVEDRVGTLADRVGVVEDNILNHAKSGMVEALDHLAVLEHAIIWVDCIAAFWREKVDRVVAPVERVLVLNRGDRCLLLCAIGREDA